MAIGCTPPPNALRLAPAVTGDSIVFELTNADGKGAYQGWIYGLSVFVCDTERSVWTIASDGSRSLPARIVYGEPIPGYVVRVGPERLVPGCYEAVASGTQPFRFNVSRGQSR